MEESYKNKGGNILIQFAKLLLGIFGLEIKFIIIYIIHIIFNILITII